MLKRALTVDLPSDLYREFINTVTEKNGCWREEELPQEALESAVAWALLIFINKLRGRRNLVELHNIVLKSMVRSLPKNDNDGWN